jgi:Domain of unknown function (DUF4136)
MTRTLTVLSLVALATLSLTARVKVQSDFDPNADFSKLKVWAWPSGGPGQMKMALTKDDDPEVLRKRFEPVIVAAVEDALAKKGFQKASAGQPADFLVAYFGLLSLNTSAQVMGQFLPGTMEWGIPPFEGRTQSLKIYEQGSLVLDAMTPESKPMWRGIARAEVHRERPDAERDKNLRAAVNDLVKEFPPKKAKKR